MGGGGGCVLDILATIFLLLVYMLPCQEASKNA